MTPRHSRGRIAGWVQSPRLLASSLAARSRWSASAGWVSGFHLRPSRLRRAATAPATVPIPDGLPGPVDRFYRTLYGSGVPVVEAAVVTGRGELQISGLRLPARYRFTHRAGRDYHHYFETTIYGWPVLKVNEYNLDGHARMELPGGVVENDAKTDKAANLALWAEAMCFPSLFLTDARVRWEPTTGRGRASSCHFGAGEDAFTARFDPATGRLTSLEALRWKACRTAPVADRVARRGERLGDLRRPMAAVAAGADLGRRRRAVGDLHGRGRGLQRRRDGLASSARALRSDRWPRAPAEAPAAGGAVSRP